MCTRRLPTWMKNITMCCLRFVVLFAFGNLCGNLPPPDDKKAERPQRPAQHCTPYPLLARCLLPGLLTPAGCLLLYLCLNPLDCLGQRFTLLLADRLS